MGDAGGDPLTSWTDPACRPTHGVASAAYGGPLPHGKHQAAWKVVALSEEVVLTAEPQAVIRHDPGVHARVLAGPGTGKSFTAMVWLAELREGHRELRTRLLTFTRAATAEFAGKLEAAGLSEHLDAPRTVHSHALSLLMTMRGHGLPMPVRLPDRWEASVLVRPDLARRLRARGFQATPTVVEDLERELAAGWETLDPEHVLLADIDPALRNAFVGLWNEHRRVFGYSLLAELTYRAGQAVEDFGDDYPPR
jgi:DNA helicase II / ATP-dependent DNA helicase PcrA